LDQPGQCCTHCVDEIGIAKAAVQLQAREDAPKEDAAFLDRHAVGGGPDGPKLRIGEGQHGGQCLPGLGDVKRFSISEEEPAKGIFILLTAPALPPAGLARASFHARRSWDTGPAKR